MVLDMFLIIYQNQNQSQYSFIVPQKMIILKISLLV